jgi:hypothetical protein
MKKVGSMDIINKRKLMKKTLKSIALLGALCGGSLHATFQFRSPLSLEDRGYMHWALAPSDQAWWYGDMPSEKTRTDWNIHFWGAGYVRNACEAFAACGPCNENKVTSDTTSLGQLFFGKAVFRGEEIFAGGTFASPIPTAGQELVNSVNPFLAFARIRPVFDYNETGAHIGVDFAKNLGADDRFHVGGRVYIPYKIIEIEQDTSIELEETLDNVFITRIVNADEGVDPDQVEYAIRYDFLSTLVFNTIATPSQTIVPAAAVKYDSLTAGNVSVTGRQVSAATVSGTGTDTNIPAGYFTKSVDGTVPNVPFRKIPSQVNGVLGADGEGVEGQTYFMQTGVDYKNQLGNDRDAQGTLFVVPRAISNPGQTNDGFLTTDAVTILTNVRAIIDGDLLISEPASTFFANNGINLLAHECIHGVGDLFAEVYGGIGHYDDWFVDGIFGVQFPTGKRASDAKRIYYQPTGNNGHLVVCLGLDGGWKPRPWFAFEIRPYFYHACKRSENRAAPFTGSTVVNIGPEIDVNVSWNYFVFRTDFSFFHPHNPDLGFQLGYELFAKGNDRVSLGDCIPCNNPTTTDLLGRPNQPINIEIFEHNTNTLTNKLRGQIFYRCNYFEIFGGGTQIVSGRHAMKESEGHLGLVIYF